MQFRVKETSIVLKKADITEEDTDAIVNAANSHLQHGGGVASAISRKGGQTIQDESDRIGFVPVGNVALTSGGKLKAKYVIHAVGPRMGEGNEDEKLRNATRNSLILTDEKRIRTLAFPAISTGIFGYPVDRCADIMLTTILEHCKENTKIQEIRFCLFDDRTLRTFEAAAKRILT